LSYGIAKLPRRSRKKEAPMTDYFPQLAEAFQRELAPGVTARLIWGEKIMLSFLEFQAGSSIPLHTHPHEQAGVVLAGELEFVIAGQRKVLKAGDTYFIPGGVEHGVPRVAGPARALDIFSPPREDYLSTT
jgi:quercetin dioxygenase-like cupin family protein